MNDEAARPDRPATPTSPAPILARQAVGVAGARQTTGLQAGTAMLRGALSSAREVMPPREYAVLVDIAARILERERARTARWAA